MYFVIRSHIDFELRTYLRTRNKYVFGSLSSRIEFRKTPGCEWDSGSIAFADSHLFKSLKSSFIPSHVYSTDTFFSLRPAALRIESALLGTDSDRVHTRSSVRLLI